MKKRCSHCHKQAETEVDCDMETPTGWLRIMAYVRPVQTKLLCPECWQHRTLAEILA